MYVVHVLFLLLFQKSEKEKLKKKGSLEKDDKVRKVTFDTLLHAIYSCLIFGKISTQ